MGYLVTLPKPVMRVKRCSRCLQDKEAAAFATRSRGGLHAWCRACVKQYDADRWQLRDKAAHRAQVAQHRKDVRSWMVSLKAATPCTDCGGSFHHEAMDWDHLPGYEKVAAVSDLVRTGRRLAAEAELIKCELVCRNCHAVRTWQRRQDQSEV